MNNLLSFYCQHCGALQSAEPKKAGESVYCTACGKATPTPQAPPLSEPKTKPQSIPPKEFIGPNIVGLLGAGIISLGIFLPFVKMPLVGTMNYFHNASTDSLILLVFAAGIAACFLIRSYVIPIVLSLLAAVILIMDVENVLTQFQIVKEKLARELAGNPFSEFATVMAEGMELEVGAFVIGAGIIASIGAAVWGLIIKQTKGNVK